MSKTKSVLTLSASVVLGGLLTAGAPVALGAGPIVTVDGSSTVFPITEAVAEEFQKDKKGAVRVTVGISGTGGGFKKFCRGEIDISDASRPIKKSEMEECAKAGIKYVELPIAYDALTVVVHPQNTWAKTLTVAAVMPAAPAPLTTDELYANLLKLDDLHKKGILTDEEFAAEKKKRLARSK